jgi:hypothetical protein
MLIPITVLRISKLNSNVMPDEIRQKLKENINAQGGKYPPVIVRKIPNPPTDFDIKNTEGEVSGYRIIDGHNRTWACRELGYPEVNCEVWDIDDKTEMLLMATLNELKGTQDLTKRALLLKTIEIAGVSRENLLQLIPEDTRRLDFVLSIIENRDFTNVAGSVLERNDKTTAERNALVEKFMKDGFDQKKAEAMADIHSYQQYVPKPKQQNEGVKVGSRPLMIFWFNSQVDYVEACEFFNTDGEKEPETSKLIELVKKAKAI